MARVWLARLHGAFGFEKLVALKTIRADAQTARAKDDARERLERMFLDEARLASAIDHPNVVHTLDLGEHDGVLFLAMEWIDGAPLSRLHHACENENRTLPLGVVFRVVADVCRGLHAAHELVDDAGQPLSVVHRDVSPQNILVSTAGVAKLIDFGIAKARGRTAFLQESADAAAGLINGKLQFMAPEQALGRNVDRRTDVFAAGATLYFLLSNRPAYDGPTALAALHVLTSGRAPLPLPTRVPSALAEVVLRAIAHRPSERFATADALADAIEGAMRTTDNETSTHDVARLLSDELGERMASRRRAIERAVEPRAPALDTETAELAATR